MTGPDTHIDAEALAAALDEHNRWRRDDDGEEPAPNPTELGRTIDAAAGMLRTLSERVAALEAERAAWRGLYRRAVNEANGLTNYVEDRPELRRAERNLTAIEAEARILAAAPTPTGDAPALPSDAGGEG